MRAPQEGEDGGGRPGDNGDDWLRRRRRRRGPSELASARRLELCRGQPQQRMVFRVGSGDGGGVVETKGGRCFNVGRQGGGRKVTWASIRAAAPMIMAVQFSAVKLSFATGTRLSGGKFNHLLIARVPYLQLEISLYYNAIFS